MLASILGIGACLWILCSYFSSYLFRAHFPPIPWFRLPVIGHLHLLGRKPYLSMQKLSKKYGPLFMLQFGANPAIVASSPQMAREILKQQDLVFSSRPYLVSGRYLFYNFKDMLTPSYGEHFSDVKKFCVTELLSAKKLASFSFIRLEEVSLMLSCIGSSAGKEVVVRNYLTNFLFNVIARMLMGKPFFGRHGVVSDDGTASELLQMLKESIHIILGLSVSEFFPHSVRPWLDWLDPNVHRARKLQARQDIFLQRIVDEHRDASVSSKATPDFVDMLITHYGHESQDDVIKAVMLDMFLATTDTTAVAVEWAMAELVNNPKLLKRARDELDAVVDKGELVQESHTLNYIEAIVKESLRLHPPAPILVPHCASQACKIGEYDIPKGALAFVNYFAISRDPEVWDEPLEFRPERFVGNAIDIKGRNFDLLPFSSGRRICPGAGLALKVVKLVLANLLHAFEWELPTGKCHPMDDSFNTVRSLATPLKLKVEHRNAF